MLFDLLSESNLAALVGLGGGILLGLAARLGRFCTLGAIEDYLYGGTDVRLRMWGIAIGVAVIGSFSLMASGYLTDRETYYLSIRWMPLASVVGGLLFGYGMALAGNCGFGAIARLGGGDLRSFVIVLVMGVSAFVVLNGPFAPLRAAIFPQTDVLPDEIPPGIAHYLGAATGMSANTVGIVIGVLILGFSLLSPGLRKKPAQIFWSAVVGLGILSGWAGTQWIANTGFEAIPVVSHSFSAPVGDTILWWMTGSARPLSFAVGSVAGIWGGAFIGSLIRGHFRWEACEDPRELRRQIIGAAIMGVGAVIALGCTVGQGLSAMSVLAVSAPITMAAIFAGAALGLRQLIVGFQPAE
ncbi:YeeE/YedE family protein [Mesobacterium sp. TK19101]|uniref:YeeE/YedE family protein n=1 Tax=Mesobacterium hydrothermale TaxID=3111907 RepID=A0ABU6HD89_9RHOB|nr:YeeE/YedE family protein [Mesobacterium sp. TK19101]MEC3860422.1 YeeE/YedE family protein [Mesobacterium sp. TK19101]